MLVAAGILTANKAEIVKRWKLEGGLPPVPGQKVQSADVNAPAQLPDIALHWEKTDYRLLPNSELGPTFSGDAAFRGSFVVYDWDTKQIVWREQWGPMVGMVAGYCFADNVMYMNDLEGASIFSVDVRGDVGRLLKRVSHPYLNDLHSCERTSRGLLVTCSGTDLIVELDLDGNPLWEWWAAEHGYDVTPSGKTRTAERDREHRNQYYHTRYHTTHVNDATFRDPGERYVLALLFHQGQLIEIDRSLPLAEQHARVVLDGLARPHGLERTPLGWLFCNSLSKELILLDDELKVRDRIEYDGGWIQDCTMLSNGHIVLNDVDNNRLVEFSGPPWKIVETVGYDTNWRMGELIEIPAPYDEGFKKVAAAAALG